MLLYFETPPCVTFQGPLFLHTFCLSLSRRSFPSIFKCLYISPIIKRKQAINLLYLTKWIFLSLQFPSLLLRAKLTTLLMPHSFLNEFHLSLTLPDSPNSYSLFQIPSQKLLSNELPLAAYLLNAKDIFQSLPVFGL